MGNAAQPDDPSPALCCRPADQARSWPGGGAALALHITTHALMSTPFPSHASPPLPARLQTQLGLDLAEVLNPLQACPVLHSCKT